MAALAGSVARRYARALFQIGVDTGTFEALGQELDDLAELFQDSAELRQTLVNPVFKPAEKRAILEKILPRVTPSPVMQRFALLLLDRGRIALLASLARAYRELADAHAGRVRAVVTSARRCRRPTWNGCADRSSAAPRRRSCSKPRSIPA